MNKDKKTKKIICSECKRKITDDYFRCPHCYTRVVSYDNSNKLKPLYNKA
jgi:DNA-directed RNA polymerase subunit RPC12/RpoP